MSAAESIENKFKYFDVDDYESHINQQVKERRDWSGKHFLLAKSNKEQILPPLGIGRQIGFFAELNILFDEKNSFSDKPPCSDEGKQKKELLNHIGIRHEINATFCHEPTISRESLEIRQFYRQGSKGKWC